MVRLTHVTVEKACIQLQLTAIEDHYGYSIEKLLEEEVAFFVICHDGIAAGCSGIKLFGTAYGEVDAACAPGRSRSCPRETGESV
jgi:hypothetical protein